MKAKRVERVERRRRLVEINLLDGAKVKTKPQGTRRGCTLPFVGLLAALAGALAFYLALR